MKLSARQLKYVKSLQIGKYRQKYHKFIVEGEKLAAETLGDSGWNTAQVFALPQWLEENRALLAGQRAEITAVTPAELKKLSLLSTPNQVLLVVHQPEKTLDEAGIRQGLSLYLDDLQDPGNLGTILRIADWFGISTVFRSRNSVEVFHPKVVQASMGAFLRVNSPEFDFFELSNRFPSLPIYGATLDGSDVFSEKLPEAALLVIGNESKGICPAILEQLTHKVAVPRHPAGKAESLNAAVATGILCAAFRCSKLSSTSF